MRKLRFALGTAVASLIAVAALSAPASAFGTPAPAGLVLTRTTSASPRTWPMSAATASTAAAASGVLATTPMATTRPKDLIDGAITGLIAVIGGERLIAGSRV